MKRVYVQELNAECRLVDSYADLRKRGDVRKLVQAAYLNPLGWDVRLELLRKLFDAPPRVWEQLEREENRDELWRLMTHLDWVWKGPQVRPFPWVRLRGKNWHLPDEDLHWLNTAEFVIATAHLLGFWTASDNARAAESMGKFLATIVRRKPDVVQQIRNPSRNGDPREPYDTARCEYRWRTFARYLDLPTQILIAQWFNNASNRMLDRFGMKAEPSDDVPLISQGVFVQDWERQVIKVSESQVFGSYDQVMQRPIQDVLSYIELKNDEMRNRKNANA